MTGLQWHRAPDAAAAILLALLVWLLAYLLSPRGADLPRVVGRWIRDVLADIRWGWGLP